MRPAFTFRLFAAVAVLLSLCSPVLAGTGGASVTTVDLLGGTGLGVNGAGPVLVMSDPERGRVVAVHTLSAAVSLIDCATGEVQNIATGGRAFQHLKAESMTIRRSTGDVCFVGQNCFHIVSVSGGSCVTVDTGVQFESIAVDEKTGNVFLAGRESAALGFYDASEGRLRMLDWLETSEQLINLNATPPPPLRKVIADGKAGVIVAVDGTSPALYIFDAASGRKISSRKLQLAAGGRWHLAGYDAGRRELFIVTETTSRKVIEAAKIDVGGGSDLVVALPGYTEGVGVIYSGARREVYIPYDNHPSVHVVDFSGDGALDEIMIPAYGNDATALDEENGFLYVTSWAHGEIDAVDLASRKLFRRHTGLGIIPHMFTMAFDRGTGRLFYPRGASAVNGTFGAAVSWFDPGTGERGKIRTGWAPVDLIDLDCRGSVLVFGSEDRFAEVKPDGSFETHVLPRDYPLGACRSPEGDVYLSYGPHQSYWPVVYIWGARNGILTIDKGDLSFYDRRIPRQAMAMAMGSGGTLYFTQNNWGKEKQFIGRMRDQVRLFDINDRIETEEEVVREVTQRLLEYDPGTGSLLLVRTGEEDDDPSVLEVIDPDSSRIVARVETGVTATGLYFDPGHVYVAGFDSGDITVVDRSDWSKVTVPAGSQPLRLRGADGGVVFLCHDGNFVGMVAAAGQGQGAAARWDIPVPGRPDNIFRWGDRYVVSTFEPSTMRLLSFDPESGSFEVLFENDYPYGDTSMDSRNVSFYMRGQYGDAVFSLTRAVTDASGRLWISDFLSGSVYILEK